jgi:hypothetical protein
MTLPLRSVALLAGGALALLAPASALAGSKTVTRDGVSATLSWSEPAPGGDPAVVDPHLTISRNGVQVIDRDLGTLCQLCYGLAEPRKALRVRNINRNPEPEVLVDLYSGGAHCCWSTAIFSRKGKRYGVRVGQWGNSGYRLRDLDPDAPAARRGLEFVTVDDRFAYRFTAYAFSLRPPRVFQLSESGRLVDRTHRFLGLIRGSLREMDKLIIELEAEPGSDLRGAVATRVADMYLLGRDDEVDAYLADQLAKGNLEGDAGWPAGEQFKPALLKFLGNSGYIR